ncbi:MAG TPA: HD domain-containing phosphohydrolase [Fibrobacteria bacterium]|nr:HD domain-containing phosphohydrolase [Fibrobacteria bacterium]
MSKHSEYWDTRRDKEIRQTLSELRALADAGYFEGLQPQPAVPEDLKLQSLVAAQLSKGAVFARKVQVLKPMDNPVGPALTQFMTQLLVRDRTEPYKQETLKKFEDAVGQVRILFGKIVRGEIASNAIIRSIVASFLDTFMKDRNLLLNLAAFPQTGPDYLYDHSVKMCLFSLSLASAAGYSRSQSIEIAQGALLADVGMMLIPERIRLKRGKLNEGELFEMRKHPILGLSLLEHVHGLSEAVLVIPYQHHERISGSGYPDSRSGQAVSRFSRIVSIADVFTALTNQRSYRESLVPYQAMLSLLSMGGSGHLDGEHIRQFLRTMSIFPLGSLVRLASGKVAKVVSPNASEFTKPVVSVLTNESGAPLGRFDIVQVDLAASDEKIVEALPHHSITHGVLDGF